MHKYHYSIILIIGILLGGFAISSFKTSPQQEEDPIAKGDMVIIRTIEIWGLKPAKMIVSYNNGESETVSLKGFGMKNVGHNLNILRDKLNGFLNDGYTLISSTGGNSEGIFVNTYILRKE